MSSLKINKVTSLPGILTPSTLYLVKNDSTNKLDLHLTDNLGVEIYHSYNSTDIYSIINTIISSLLDQPGGLVSLDLDGNITGVNQSLIEYVFEFVAINDGAISFGLPRYINTTNHELHINGLKQSKNSYTINTPNNSVNLPSTLNIITDDVITFNYYEGRLITLDPAPSSP